ncbi:uncharacterized protein LOC126900801 isoform X2 [Daktulosphaira vitifoliae]|uniref:uncharacterized protein LOC126900801 isoform X1 n=1 Tax=Daktulosphaira vitifoliae TaxID=58002 RepID=UPI0021AA9E20|nr:uncharacterized protein LOC126900801 isoform X1 [Daktulosphaira vitifoliae]XP_050532719.1 uncharacterized protein LOC126900801 isoform X2 [Daktulosphaira vitifoliae]
MVRQSIFIEINLLTMTWCVWCKPVFINDNFNITQLSVVQNKITEESIHLLSTLSFPPPALYLANPTKKWALVDFSKPDQRGSYSVYDEPEITGIFTTKEPTNSPNLFDNMKNNEKDKDENYYNKKRTPSDGIKLHDEKNKGDEANQKTEKEEKAYKNDKDENNEKIKSKINKNNEYIDNIESVTNTDM